MRSRGLLLLAPALMCLCWVSCTSYRELGDGAFDRGDWETAVTNYKHAIAESSEAEELNHLKTRLAQSQAHAGSQYLASARDLMGIGAYPVALEHAQKAFGYSPTPEVQRVLRELRQREGARLLGLGKTAFQGGHWDEAVRNLERAESLVPSAEGATWLVKAKAESQKYHAAEFARLEPQARERLRDRDWSAAASLYEAAHRHRQSTQSMLEHGFAVRMAEADAMFADRPSDSYRAGKAAQKYRHALSCGLDTAYVQERLQAIEPASYLVTLNSAVILPFKAGSEAPWDGFGGKNTVGTGELLRDLAAFALAPELDAANWD